MTKRIYALSIDNLCFDLSKVLKTLVEQSDRYEKEIERLNARVASLEELIGTRKQDFHDIVNGR